MQMFEYVRETDTCQLTNSGLIDYITQPAVRNGGKPKCRLTNFAVGEDLVRAQVTKKRAAIDGGGGGDGDDAYTVTGRLSSAYCSAFDKEFEPSTRTCEVSWLDTVLSYTFLGEALLRFARHAVHGGDRCDETFPAARSRAAEPPADGEDERLLSRSRWFNDVDRAWVCPPPNVLLSDLNVRSSGEVWTNRNGGSVERAVPSDYGGGGGGQAGSVGDGDDDSSFAKKLARRSLAQRNDGRRRRDIVTAATATVMATTTVTTVARDEPFVGSVAAAENDDDGKVLLDFDKIYETQRTSAIVREIAKQLGEDLGKLAVQHIVHNWLERLMKFAYNRTLRFAGQRLGGAASRTLVALGVRVSTSRLMATAMSGLTTRVIRALGSAATGVGLVLTVAELLSFALDMALLFGWDPGDYKSEIGNATFDGMAAGWLRSLRFQRVTPLDPSLVLRIYGDVTPGNQADAGDGARDDSAEATAPRVDRRFAVHSIDDAPWFFRPFAAAVRAMADDAGGDGATALPDGTRIRPIFADSPIVCDLLWTVHYFSHRRVNSNGQRVRGVGAGRDLVTVDDEFVHDAVRSNELAAFLRRSTLASSVPSTRLVGAARRNFIAKSVRAIDHAIALAGLAFGATLALLSSSWTRSTNDPPLLAVWTLALALLCVALPLTLIPAVVETVAAADGGAATATTRRSYDRKNETADRDDLDRVCDAVVEALLNVLARDDSVLARLAAAPFRPELRVLAAAAAAATAT